MRSLFTRFLTDPGSALLGVGIGTGAVFLLFQIGDGLAERAEANAAFGVTAGDDQ